MVEEEFEKLWLFLQHTRDGWTDTNIALANCPDDWSLCSAVVSARNNKKHQIIGLLFDKEETIKIRDALSAIINDMGE